MLGYCQSLLMELKNLLIMLVILLHKFEKLRPI
jgi:hypothetical protein